MAEISIDGKLIVLTERPKHRAVISVENIMTDWMMGNIDVKSLNLNEGASIEDTLKQAMLQNSNVVAKVTKMQQTLELDKTIILATGYTLKELDDLKDDMYEDDYHRLFNASVHALGGTAEDFLDAYTSSTPSKKQVQEDLILEEKMMEMMAPLTDRITQLELAGKAL